MSGNVERKRRKNVTIYVDADDFDLARTFSEGAGHGVSVIFQDYLEFFAAALDRIGYDPEKNYSKSELKLRWLQVNEGILSCLNRKKIADPLDNE